MKSESGGILTLSRNNNSSNSSSNNTSSINNTDEIINPIKAISINGNCSNKNNNNNKRFICPKCGLLINSEESLNVHMQYQHENMSRWGVPSLSSVTNQSSTTPSSLTNNNNNNNVSDSINNSGTQLTNLSSKSPTDLDNNNHHQKTKQNQLRQQQVSSPLHNNNNNGNSNNNNSNNNNSVTATVSAAADSSNNQSPTPGVPNIGTDHHPHHSHHHHHQGIPSHNINSTAYHHHHHQHQQQGSIIPQDMHAYNPYVHGYDFPPHPSIMDSSMYPMPYQTAGTEYKSVPSNRYHPYHNHPSNSHLQHSQQQQQHSTNQVATAAAAATTNGTNPASSSASNSSLSPRVVSSSSPTQNSIMGGQTTGTTQDSTNPMTHIPQPGQPTPSPSPKQCDKCGYVCQTDVQLNEHYSSTHGIQQQNDNTNRSNTGNGDENDIQNQYTSYQPYIKEEPSSDILDLDSQKMIYPATGPGPIVGGQESLPSMHSMHAMHRSSLMWGPEMHSGYMPHSQTTDIKQGYFPPMRPPYPPIKQEYPNIKSEYSGGGTVGGGSYGVQGIKSEFNAHHQSILPQNRGDIKTFTTDITPVNNPTTSSPSEFPSTTTPQDNGSQYRGFEPPTSSLSNNAGGTKSATWKSNEARRPKTYNCTACNKWFTSSGHLKRHYNTTLHKNAVKSSGQPDPATMPISVHHHPARDPNSKHHRNNQSQQPPPAPPEPPRSPEYTPQYTPPPGGFTQTGSFQQYNPTSVSIHSNGHPNGQAGPSVHASQPRDLLTISTTEAMCNQQSGDRSLQQQREDPEYHQHQVLEEINPGQQQQQLQQQQLPQQPQQQQHQETHFILDPHMSVQQDTTSPHHHHHHHTITHNIMDQQYIINHLQPINTPNTIQSYQRMLQAEVQEQANYTITGNGDDSGGQIDANDTDGGLHLMDSIAYDALTSAAAAVGGVNPQHQYQIVQQIQTIDGQQISRITTINPSTIMELQRLSQTQESIIYPQNVPELMLPGSPQEADIAPQQQQQQHSGRTMTASGNITSPNMPPSTTTTILMIPVSSNNTKYNSQQMFTPIENNNNNNNKNNRNNNNNIILKRHRSSPLGISTISNDLGAALSPTPSSSSLTSSTSSTISLSSTGSSLSTTPTGTTGTGTGAAATGTGTATASSASPTTEQSTKTTKVECRECGKEFAKACYLTQHNKTLHSGEQPYRCQKCGKRFQSQDTYDIHLDKHKAKNKPFKCDTCPKQFHHKTDLRRHKDGHNGYKAHVCHTCNKGFCRKDHLRKHCDTHKPKPQKVTSPNTAAATATAKKLITVVRTL